MEDCYDKETNTCDGRCQGCCSCIRAEWIKGYREEPTIEEMIAYREEAKEDADELALVIKQVIEEMKADGTFEKLQKEMFKGEE